ncbi:hypothetical protein HAX54_012305, partial [Datura stramonium]|nr:hypothetical protein [Datura stramonium]
PGDAHTNYLKLISGTSLEEDHCYEDDGSSEDGDYEDEMTTEESEEFDSVDSEDFDNEDQVPMIKLLQISMRRVVEEYDQHVKCSIDWMGANIIVSSVYAKCDERLREELWDNLRDISQKILPTLVYSR